MSKQIIGSTTTYVGTEYSGLRGARVRIEGVSKGALRAGFNPDAEDSWIDDDEALWWLGGVGSEDRVEVRPWSELLSGWSFIVCVPRAIDLACFTHLRANKTNKHDGERS